MIEKVDPLSEVGVCVLAVRGCASARGRLSTVLVGGRLSRNHAQLAMLMPTPFRMICSVSEFLMLWFGTLVGVAVCCLVLVSLATCFCVHLSGHGVCEMDVSAPLCFSRASEKGWFVYLRFLSRFWVSKACSRHMMAYSILCFMCGYMSHVWRILNKGTLHQEGE